jgi:tRNA(His) guanylyltransferase
MNRKPKPKTSLGDRMKNYEDCFRISLPGRMPLILRVDGRAFHTLTKGLEKPFDTRFSESMLHTALMLCEEIQGAKLAYWQSDEISILATDYDMLTTQAWFDKNLQKMVSISASVASVEFNEDFCGDKPATFDSRAFVLPKEEVCNYFLWRQQDATRNSINSVGQSKFSPKQLHGKSTDAVQDMLFKEKGLNWNDLPIWQKRGACIVRNAAGYWAVDYEIPIFSKDRNYVNKFVNIGED